VATLNSTHRYGTVAIFFHWTIALLILINLAIGFTFANVMANTDWGFFTIVQTHKSIGLTVLVLSLLRLGWRLINPIPELPTDFGIPMRVLARGTHYLFYFLIVAVPFVGWTMVSASALGTPTNFYGLFHWPNLPFFNGMPRADKRQYHELFSTMHAVLAYSALGLLVLHATAALWHHYRRQDTVLRRMLPGTDVSPA